MKTQRTKKQKVFLVFTTLADVGSLFMSFFYIAYVCLMMILDVGPLWLNLIMVGITVLYCWFVFFKIIYLNRIMQRVGRVKRIVKMSSKYTKYVLRVINAAFVVLTLVGTQFWESVDFSHVIAIIGIVVMCISLFFSIIWDIWNLLIRLGVKKILGATASARGAPQIETSVQDEQTVKAYGEEVK
jgi:hypothetical protein